MYQNSPTSPRRSTRKRKQNEMSHPSESDCNPTDEYHPPNKKRKVNHTDTPHPQRRSTRLACKQSQNGYTHEHKDLSQTNSINTTTTTTTTSPPRRKSKRLQHKKNNNNTFQDSDFSIDPTNTPTIDTTNVNSWTNRLRKSTQKNHTIDDEDDDPDKLKLKTKKKRDSDYGDAEFEQDLQEQQIEEIDDMNDADDMDMNDESDYSTSGHTRRRSKRLSAKSTIHYYNDGTDIQIEHKHNDNNNTHVNGDLNGEKSKSNSLPLSLRRPKRIRKPVVRIYEVEQFKQYKIQQDRRQSLRKKNPVNYAESSDENVTSDDDEVGTSISTTRSPSRSYRNRRKNRRKRTRGRGRGRGRKKKRNRSVSYNSSDSSTEYSTDTLMDLREQKRIRRERKKIQPIQLHDLGLYNEGMAPNLDQNTRKNKNKVSADISPMEIDMNISWNMVGGLQHHVQKLKEMVILPLLYPHEFEAFKMSTPKGVLFHGPPGTGKTLVARILAAQCSQGTNADGSVKKKVAFYMRKGADCLSKWVGEAERQLRLLFDEAHKNQPAVIFFDEIDGLAPVRSSRQDQIHSSIVSTLLALMDGLDSRGQIIVIGATNRPDAIDPALRRPGRFDRELRFGLPGKKARKDILKIHTKAWDESSCRLDEAMLTYLSEQSVGYCGADLEALCREAFLAAVRRTYPQIYHSNVRLQIDTKKLQVIREDFEKALKDITPSSQRSSLVYARALPDLLQPLLNDQLSNIKSDIEGIFSLKKAEYEDTEIAVMQDNHNNTNNNRNTNHITTRHNSQHYRYLIHGNDASQGQNYLGPAVLHLLEEYPMYSLDLASIYGDSSTKCADEAILRIFKEAARNTPSVIYWPHVDRWWQAAHEILKTSITLLINDISASTPILLIATSNINMEHLEPDLLKIFAKFAFHNCNQTISQAQRQKYWTQIGVFMTEKPKHKPKTIEQYPQLPIAELPVENDTEMVQNNNIVIDKTESEILIQKERMCCVNLRVYIRSVCNRLCKHFKNFIDQMAEDGVCNNNLSLFEIRQRNNERAIPTVVAFLTDIDQLVENVRSSAQTESLKARQFINEACHLQDQALSMMSQVNRDLVKQCDKMAQLQGSGGQEKRVSFAQSEVVLGDDNDHNHNKQSDKSEKDDEDMDMVMDEDVEILHDNNDNKEEENGEDGYEVEINVDGMNGIINKLIKVTKDYVIEEMEEKMYNLLRIIYGYSNEWNRNEMVDELDRHIETYFKAKQNH